MKARHLNPRQQAFAEHYAACSNGTEAARRAGYRQSEQALGVTATRMLKDARIQAAIAACTAKASAGRIATAERVQEVWTSILEDVKASPADRLRAGELLGKVHGLFVERSQNDHRLEIVVRRGADAAAALIPAAAVEVKPAAPTLPPPKTPRKSQ